MEIKLVFISIIRPWTKEREVEKINKSELLASLVLKFLRGSVGRKQFALSALFFEMFSEVAEYSIDGASSRPLMHFSTAELIQFQLPTEEYPDYLCFLLLFNSRTTIVHLLSLFSSKIDIFHLLIPEDIFL